MKWPWVLSWKSHEMFFSPKSLVGTQCFEGIKIRLFGLIKIIHLEKDTFLQTVKAIFYQKEKNCGIKDCSCKVEFSVLRWKIIQNQWHTTSKFSCDKTKKWKNICTKIGIAVWIKKGVEYWSKSAFWWSIACFDCLQKCVK